MNHRERILSAIQHKPVDRIPTIIWATEEVQEILYDHLGIETGKGSEPEEHISFNGGYFSRNIIATLELMNVLHIDGVLNVIPPYIGPEIENKDNLILNEWGFGYKPQKYGSGVYTEQTYFPLESAETLDDLKTYQWPDPDWYDYNALPGIISKCDGRAISCGYHAVFTYHNYLRGLETSLMDPLLRPEMTRYIIERLSEIFTEKHKRCFEAAPGLIDITQVTDDYGSQNGLMISPKIFETFYRPAVQKGIDLAKNHAIYILHHDDGDCRKLIPTLVEMGIDILNPIQWRCGDWDLEALKSSYGDKICFHSAVDNQRTIPFGTPDDIRIEVKYLIETLANDKTGFIIGPCHNIQAVTPVENVIALFDACQEYGKVS